ncbi:hypothetical protein [Thorsellia kenyensis]|uniref:Peptidase M14 carboxypeptidase A domain-containing protein n=1 Tax=Thorsellia kenyensis TaxID=1549888 RepID=A0ABV6CCR2_9GAMM
MSLALEVDFNRTLDSLKNLVEQSNNGYIDVWLFEDRLTRKKIAQQFSTSTKKVTLHSAYKPLLNHFLDREDAGSFTRLTITYPIVQNVDEKRFLLECYPLNALLKTCQIEFIPSKVISAADAPLFYDIEGVNQQLQTLKWKVFAPNLSTKDSVEQESLNNCGWIIYRNEENIVTPFCEQFDKNTIRLSEHLSTEFELIFQSTMDFIKILAIKRLNELVKDNLLTLRPLFFEQLIIDIQLPMKDDELNYGHEIISFQEILHEDIYFGVLELLEFIAAPIIGSVDMRTLQTGQILPIIRYSESDITLAIYTREYSTELPNLKHQVIYKDGITSIEALKKIKSQLSLSNVYQLLNSNFNKVFETQSVLNHPVKAAYVKGADKPVLISAAQHANETSAVIGVMTASENLLKENEQAHFSLVPIENPDGYDMHQQFLCISPWHIHHAVRYTALGDDLEYRKDAPLYEKGIRKAAFDIAYEQSTQKTLLHINMHGYPSHEWTRPLSGYIPRGFSLWTIPKGMFLIVRYHRGYERIANELLDKVTLRLATNNEIMAFNKAQISMYENYAGKMPFEFKNGFPFIISEDNRSIFPITFITEYPDETLQGEAYMNAHKAQSFACEAIYSEWQTIEAVTLNSFIN